MSDAVDFLHVDKHESLLKIDTKLFWWVWSSIPEVPKKASLQCLYNIPKKLEMKLTFLMQINIKVSNSWFQQPGHQSFLQCDRHDHEIVKDMVVVMIKHFQSTQSNKFAMSLQYLLKEVMNGVLDFWFKLPIFDESSQTGPKYWKGKFVKFEQYIKKIIATVFVFYCDARHSDTLLGSSRVCRYFFLGGCGKKWARLLVHKNSEILREWID